MTSKIIPPILAVIVLIAFISASINSAKNQSITVDEPIKRVGETLQKLSPTPTPETSLSSIIIEFSAKDWSKTLPSLDLSLSSTLLKTALTQSSDNPSLLTTINQEIQRLKSLPLADAPEMRAVSEAQTKLCLAKTYVVGDYTKTLSNCGIKDNYPSAYIWKDPDDLTALSQVLPFAITADYYTKEGDDNRASYYWQQILNHRTALQNLQLEPTDSTYKQLFTLIPPITPSSTPKPTISTLDLNSDIQ